MDVMVTTGAIKDAELNRHHQQINIGQMPLLSSNQKCQNNEGKQSIKFHRLAHPKLTRGLPITKAPGYFQGESANLHEAKIQIRQKCGLV